MAHAEPASPRAAGARLVLVLAPLAAGLLAASLLFVDYVSPAPVFCGYEGGCAALKTTPFAYWLGIPTPAIGLAAYAVMGVLASLRGAWARRALLGMSLLGTLLGLGLVMVQMRLGTFCKLCLVTDLSFPLVLAAALFRDPSRWSAAPARARAIGGAVLAALVVVPLASGLDAPSALPAPIAKELRAAPRGTATVVDFVDFECPYCRLTNVALKAALAGRGGKVRVVRKHVPLTGIHAHALDAARAACCGEELGKGDAMADALFACPPSELTKEGCESIASKVGVDLAAYRACVADPRTDRRIEADTSSFGECQGEGLPTLFVEGQKLEGMQSREALERALDRVAPRS